MPPSIYPTGVTIFSPDKCWNGYTIFQSDLLQGKKSSAVLVDMNGNVINQWKGLDGMPNKMLPGGQIIGSTGVRKPKYGHQDMIDLVQADWDGNIVWKFNRYEQVKDPYTKPTWMARCHHDFQREGNPVGYYIPDMNPLVDRGNTIILCHKNLKKPEISERLLLDDAIIEVNWNGDLIWEWNCSDHFEDLGFSEEAKSTIYRNPHVLAAGPNAPGVDKGGDWMHLNSVSLLGPNKWFDQGDKRFNPENIIWSSRNANIIGITEKETGKVVWRVGPDYDTSPELKNLGWIIGQHHAHIIPRGLPGEGNILVFDNGGTAGYGAPNPGSPTGVDNAIRGYSRIIEFNPVTLEIAWQSIPKGRSGPGMHAGLKIFSSFISSAQRLPNGNTMITEGNSGRIIEVTPSLEIVWEYVSPYFEKRRNANLVYRAYRLPYEWVPQADKPEEKAIIPRDNSKYRVPGSSRKKPFKTTWIQ